MSAQDYAALSVAILSILGGVAAYVQFMIKHYLSELKPNSGKSLRDEIDRLSVRVDTIIDMLRK
jgi:hypothetical protein